jgi:hypothetical protein
MHNQKSDAAEYMAIKYRRQSKTEEDLDKAEALMLKAIAWFELAEHLTKENK